MTRIDFYQIESDEEPLLFTCRLIEKVYRLGLQVYVHAGHAEDANRLDDLLWTFREDRFIPHQLQQSAGRAPIKIGYDYEPVEHQEVLVNLSGLVPDFFSRFSRVAEVVPKDENLRNAARRNFSFYKERGYPLEYHRMTGKA